MREEEAGWHSDLANLAGLAEPTEFGTESRSRRRSHPQRRRGEQHDEINHQHESSPLKVVSSQPEDFEENLKTG
jgi:hypothetical protein